MAPFVVVGLVLALAAGRVLNALALGDDVARGLGQDVVRGRLLVVLAVVLLCGSAVSMVGPIAFVGLAVPHLARAVVGLDHRCIVAVSALLGPVLLLGADVVGRLVVRPGELEAGLVVALVGAPVLLLVVRRSRRWPHERRHPGAQQPGAPGGRRRRAARRAPAPAHAAYGRAGGAARAGACSLSGAALVVGDFPLSAGEVLGALAGRRRPVGALRRGRAAAPRLLLGVLVGVAFGLAGALFQSVLRNPLASPDIIGISQGASAGAVAALLLGGLSGAAVSLSALAGGALVGLLLYAVAWRGGMTGHRFVLSGIGVAYVCAAVVGYLLTRSEVDQAQVALRWMAGSLAQAEWGAGAGAGARRWRVLVPLVALVARRLDLLLLGDDPAAAWGCAPRSCAPGVIALGVALACAATAAAGPVAFVAFVAAPVARRLLADGGLALVESALVGVVLVVGADLVAQHLLPGDLSVPVGGRHRRGRRALPDLADGHRKDGGTMTDEAGWSRAACTWPTTSAGWCTASTSRCPPGGSR